jgi:RNA polymerase sigma factor (sigma-70 family)
VGKAKESAAGFDAMFREHYPRLVRSLSVAGDGAADAVQEAFVQALLRWKVIGRYDDPVGWVRHVAVHRMLNEHRSRRRRNSTLQRLSAQRREPVESADSLGAPDEHLIALVVALPRQQRIAVALRYYDDLPVAEVAAAMGISEGAVRYHLHAARQRLRTVVGTIDG